MNLTGHPGYDGHRALMQALFGPSGQPPAWRADAGCADTSTETFFDQDATGEALEICAGCPVRELCRADQFDWESRTRSRRFYAAGVVGGTTASTRNQTYYPRKSRKDVA
ncbi:WhiB family transcriptional regulator [Actinosynnema sp. CA-248983]